MQKLTHPDQLRPPPSQIGSQIGPSADFFIILIGLTFLMNAIGRGATETFDAFSQGELQAMLSSSSVVYNREINVDPYSLLPTWLHPR